MSISGRFTLIFDSSGSNQMRSATGNRLGTVITLLRIRENSKDAWKSERHSVELQDQHSSLFPPTVVVELHYLFWLMSQLCLHQISLFHDRNENKIKSE